jgi:hypothetical protein
MAKNDRRAVERVDTQNVDSDPREIAARADLDLERAVGLMAEYNAALDIGQIPPIPPGPQSRVDALASLRRADVSSTRKQAETRTTDIVRRARKELALTRAPARPRATAARRIDVKAKWARVRIREFASAALKTIATSRYWALNFERTKTSSPLPGKPVDASVDKVWEKEQTHNLGGSPIKVRKTKVSIKIPDAPEPDFNMGILLSFPDSPGVKRKLLSQSGSTTAGGITITAFDTPGLEKGNPVAPAPPGGKETKFWGYGKIIYVKGLGAGCKVRYRQIKYGSAYLLPSGSSTWTDAKSGDSGKATEDPKGASEYPSHDLGNGMNGMADFPNWDPSSSAICTYAVRDEKYRSWLVLECPGKAPQRLGYWEWSFRIVLHVAAGGLESLDSAPQGVAAPPCGWPTPGTGPTTWVPEASASDDAKGDYNRLFP